MNESDLNNRPSAGCLYILLYMAMAISGTIVLQVAGNKSWLVFGIWIFGSYLALPVSVCIGMVVAAYVIPRLRGK